MKFRTWSIALICAALPAVNPASGATKVVFGPSGGSLADLVSAATAGENIKVRYVRGQSTFIRQCNSITVGDDGTSQTVSCFIDNAFDTATNGTRRVFANPVGFERVIVDSDAFRSTIKVEPNGNRLKVSGQDIEEINLEVDWIVVD